MDRFDKNTTFTFVMFQYKRGLKAGLADIPTRQVKLVDVKVL